MSGAGPAQIRAARRDRVAAVVVVSAVGGVIAGASIVASAMDRGSVPIALALLMVVLSIIEAQRESVFSDETAVSGSVVVVTAAIAGVATDSALVPVLCAVGAALHAAHIRHREIAKILVNMGSMAGPAFVASELFHRFSPEREFPGIVLGVLIAAGSYWMLNNALVGAALALVQKRALWVFVWELIRSETVMLVFAVGGAMCGLVMVEVSRWTGIAALVAGHIRTMGWEARLHFAEPARPLFLQ